VTIPHLLFFILVFVLLPLFAARSRRHIPFILTLPRRPIYIQVIVLQTVLLLIALWAAGPLLPDISALVLALPSVPGILLAAVLLILAILMVVRGWSRLKPEQRLFLEAIAPRTRQDRSLWVGVSLIVGIAEETVYRGVLPLLLAQYESGTTATLLAAIAFGLAHLVQGLRAAMIASVFGAVLHLIMVVSGSLLPAIAIHFLYDAVVGILAARWIARDAVEGADANQV
jgi:membrane protease YdiL (CAAX protease family)